ncbi:cysteine and glycine-rich protein 1-like [Hydractinia symbiolongicarpus]|uniref:cysteine and glycine-rich protein 1-like n=1 Tax=Hydractinia symbiolongicarpus TaxID=13093 RepID=UPI002550B22F|nr:cysteine and glycine-rich protein 1-like [Hydractinia symbiolongicarpus]XP_057289309.1 cysteine and glycine-rich protein 1-like [Hydractinia symbiolongicarpus]
MSTKPRFGGAPKCGRCGKSVYTAEERLAAGKSWHYIPCFTCKLCNKTLQSTTVAENMKSHEIYCKSCYGKNFGPKGYGYGAGAGTLSMDGGDKGWATDNAPLSEALYNNKYLGGNECGRCGGSVYTAEEQIAAGLSWHKSCFLCKSCNKRLDSTTVQESIEEQDIYCQACYGRLFGPKGYGYGAGAGALSNTGKVQGY